jgi:hypothetical protein
MLYYVIECEGRRRDISHVIHKDFVIIYTISLS